MYNNKCPDCGAYLDACELCDCKKEKTAVAATTAAKPKERLTNVKLIISHGDTKVNVKIQSEKN